MASSKELKKYIDHIIMRSEDDIKSGDDAAGYANAVLMLTRSYILFLGVEQQMAMNFTSRTGEGTDGEGKRSPKN